MKQIHVLLPTLLLIIISENNNILFITSYDKIKENSLCYISDYSFFYLVLDEIHVAKNPKSKIYNCLKQINSKRRIFLTGTPIQNNVMELWSLFNLLMPGFLGSESDFDIKYHKKIHCNIKKLNLEEKLEEKIFQASLAEIKKWVKPFILRRMKQDVLKELPNKIIQDYICEMETEQRELYNYWDSVYQNPSKEKMHFIKVIGLLRKICNFPGLLEKKYTQKTKKLREIDPLMISHHNYSCKARSLETILNSLGFASDEKTSQVEIYENKIILFSQFNPNLQIIADFLRLKFPSMNYLHLSSDIKGENERQAIIDRFNQDTDINILLLTTKSGGLGINLTSANIVIMFDHDWNPMNDLQAMDRAHRLGQKKTVEVFR